MPVTFRPPERRTPPKAAHALAVDTVDVRRAQPADLDGLVPLFDAYRDYFASTGNAATSRHFLSDRLTTGDSVIFAGELDGGICGFVQLYPLFSSWYARRLWFLSDLFVAEHARGLGFARALVARCERHARETGAKGLLVEIPFSEPRLVSFYEALGYRKDAVFEVYRLDTRE